MSVPSVRGRCLRVGKEGRGGGQLATPTPSVTPPAGANPCEHLGRCVNTQGSFLCQCGRGYTGPRCETDVNECLSGPCRNQATCLDRIGQFTCICMAGVWWAWLGRGLRWGGGVRKASGWVGGEGAGTVRLKPGMRWRRSQSRILYKVAGMVKWSR